MMIGVKSIWDRVGWGEVVMPGKDKERKQDWARKGFRPGYKSEIYE